MKMKLPLVRYIVKPVLASIAMAIAILLIHQPAKFIYRFITPSRLTSIPVVIISIGIGIFCICISYDINEGNFKR